MRSQDDLSEDCAKELQDANVIIIDLNKTAEFSEDAIKEGEDKVKQLVEEGITSIEDADEQVMLPQDIATFVTHSLIVTHRALAGTSGSTRDGISQGELYTNHICYTRQEERKQACEGSHG